MFYILKCNRSFTGSSIIKFCSAIHRCCYYPVVSRTEHATSYSAVVNICKGNKPLKFGLNLY